MGDFASQPTVAAAISPAGSVIGDRYEIRGVLGEGGMGTVYLAHDRELDEEIALKILRPEMASTPDALIRFRREVKLARRVTHPNVARTYDLGEHGGVRFLTMERIAGRSLREARGLSLPEILRVAWEITQGLAAAHAVGVVHRDLKPENILLTGDRVILTDFGIARCDDPESALRTSGNVVGTPAYIAPEQLEGSPVDGRTDVYALGVMLYELVAGALPFVGETAAAVAVARLTRAPAPVRAVRSDVPEGVAELVMSALARRKEDRPDAHTMASRIARLRGVGHDTEVRSRSTLTAEMAPPSTSRTVRVGAVDADDPTRALGADLARAIGDALVAEPAIRLTADGPAEEVVDVTVRAAGERVRVRLRLLDARGETLAAHRIEGTLGDPFALEDAVSERALESLRGGSGRALGAGGAHQDKLDKARALKAGGPASVRAAITMLEEVEAESPENPWIMSLLSVSLSTLAAQTGAVDEALFGRAEEIALRAIDRDPSNGLAYYATARSSAR
ncbi:MAG: serine/threonine-protein kinase [Polyangiaceae bacterium]